MEEKITIAVDCSGEWVESNYRYIWRWKNKETAHTVAMHVDREVIYENFVSKIISDCKLNCEPKDLIISLMYRCFEDQQAVPFRINDQSSLSTYLEHGDRAVLRVYIGERWIENRQDHDECDWVNMDISDKESACEVYSSSDSISTSELKTAYNHVQDDETDLMGKRRS